jgi:hypothetical protein
MNEPPNDASVAAEAKVFTARTRVLFDILLFVNVAIFVACLIQFSMLTFFSFSLFISVGFSLVWLIIVRPLSRIEMEPKTITGRNQYFQKITIPLRKIDLSRTNSLSSSFKRKFLCKDIWSVDDECIRLYRRVLGERQVTKIMTVVEKYPFRGSKSD